jgi:hypothetical protein
LFWNDLGKKKFFNFKGQWFKYLYFCKKIETMSTVQMRGEITQILQIADERIVQAVHSMLKNWVESDPAIVGFSAEGLPLTKKDLLDLVEISRKEGLTGKNFKTTELLAEVENW